jgi:hypothetical protein
MRFIDIGSGWGLLTPEAGQGLPRDIPLQTMRARQSVRVWRLGRRIVLP